MGWMIAAVGLMGGLLGWYQKITIGNALADFREGLREEFGKRFWDASLAASKVETMQRDISDLRTKINVIEDYAHKRYHDLANDVQACRLLLERREREQ